MYNNPVGGAGGAAAGSGALAYTGTNSLALSALAFAIIGAGIVAARFGSGTAAPVGD